MTPLENYMSRYDYYFVSSNITLSIKKVTSTVLNCGYNCKDKHLVTCLMVSYDERMNDCLLSTPRMACVNFPNGFFNGLAHNFSMAFLNTSNGFPNTSNAFSNTSNGYTMGTQRVSNALPTL